MHSQKRCCFYISCYCWHCTFSRPLHLSWKKSNFSHNDAESTCIVQVLYFFLPHAELQQEIPTFLVVQTNLNSFETEIFEYMLSPYFLLLAHILMSFSWMSELFKNKIMYYWTELCNWRWKQVTMVIEWQQLKKLYASYFILASSPLWIMKKHFGLSHPFPDTQSFSHEISTHSYISCVSPLPHTPRMFSKKCLPASSIKLAFHYLLISNRTKSSMEGEAQEEEWFQKTKRCYKLFFFFKVF